MLKKLFKIILAFIIFFPPLSFGPINKSLIALFHFSILLLFFVYLIQTIKTGLIEYKKITLNWFFLIFILYVTVQLFLNISKNPYNTLEVLKTVLIYFALFFATTNTVASKREITSIITQVILVAFFASVLAILQAVLVQSGEVFPLQNILAKPYNTFGIALHANRFACYISMVIFLASGMFITNISNIKISLKNKSSIKHIFSTFFDLLINQKHLLLFFVLVTMVIALFLSRSRAGIFGLTTVSIIFLYAIFYKRYSKKVAYSAILVIFAFYLLLNWIGLSGVKEELETVFYNQKSYVDRTSTYLDATKMLGDYSFYGVGLGTFPDVFRAYRTQWVVEYGVINDR